MADPYSMNRRGYSGSLLSDDVSEGVLPVGQSQAAPARKGTFSALKAKPFMSAGAQQRAGVRQQLDDALAPLPTKAPSQWDDVITGSGPTKPAAAGVDMNYQYAEAAPVPMVARRSEAAPMRGNQIATIGNSDEDRRRLEIALATTGRGSPSVRKGLMDMYQQGQQNEFDGRQASLARDQNAERGNIAQAEGFAERQLKADLGNTEAGLKRREIDGNAKLAREEIAARREEIKAKGQLTPGDIQAMKIEDAKAEREFAVQDAKYQGQLDETDEARVQTMMKEGGIPRDAALKQVALENATTGTGTGSRIEALGRRGIMDSVATKLDEGDGWLDGAASGDGFRPLQDQPLTADQRMRLDEGQVDISERGGVAGFFNRVGNQVLGNDTPRFKVSVGENSSKYMTKAEVDEIQTLKAAKENERRIREAAQRRTP